MSTCSRPVALAVASSADLGRRPGSSVDDVGRLDHFYRVTGQEIRRYKRDRPGHLVPVDVKKVAG